jgi:hypothetical protein
VAYSPVYSAPFVLGNTSDGTPPNFLVPTGFTAVIREIDLYTEAGGSKLQVGMYGAGADSVVYFAVLEAIGLNTTTQWRGHVVALADYTITPYVGGLSTNDCVYIGGYLLRNVLT